jgi:hypothetical protein
LSQEFLDPDFSINAQTQEEKTMQFKNAITATAIAGLTLLCAGLAPAVHAQQCSTSQVAGKWAFWTQGTVNGIGPRVSAGIFTLAESNNLENGEATSSLAGVGVADELFSGTYSVKADCSGKLAVVITDTSGNQLFTVTAKAYFDDGGKEMRAIFTSVVEPNGTPLTSEIVLEARKIGEQ